MSAIAALPRIDDRGAGRHQLDAVMESDEPSQPSFRWHPIHQAGAKVGELTNGVWSWRLGRNIGFGLISCSCRAGEPVEVLMDGRAVAASLQDLPFL